MITITIDLDPAHKTRAELDALSDPQDGEQYFDTTNNIYVCYLNGVWEQMGNHPLES